MNSNNNDGQHLLNLSREQVVKIKQIIESCSVRPTPDEYDEFQKQIKAVTPTPKIKVKGVPETRPSGYHPSTELVPSENFDARKHLPVGYGIASVHDSGGNCVIGNAGNLLFTLIWNCWNDSEKGWWRRIEKTTLYYLNSVK